MNSYFVVCYNKTTYIMNGEFLISHMWIIKEEIIKGW